jgi:PRC-barrel domain
MFLLKPPGVLGAAALLYLSALAAVAQQAPVPAPPDEPAAAPEEAAPGPPKRRAAPPHEAPAGHDMVGLTVFSSDGSRVGDVRAVNVGPDGNVAALHVRTGGFLGFGARIVAIPEGRFARSGQDVRVTFTAEEVGNLPQVKDGR